VRGRATAGSGPSFPSALLHPTSSSSAQLGDALLEVGAELWVGSLVLGLVGGALVYGVTYWSVLAFRRARARSSAREASDVAQSVN
ncbi:MAG: DUF2062 domain-containing protein, partial [Polyangiaceae bacterium]|nr:DUF2062 domain-containing protein [Polyangiaceae bacterium]